MIQEEDHNMEAVKANILSASITNAVTTVDAFINQFTVDLDGSAAEKKTAQALVHALKAWSTQQWMLHDSLRDIISDAKQSQDTIKTGVALRTHWLAQSNFIEYSAKAKENENGIWQLCGVIGLTSLETSLLFKTVASLVDFDSFI
jgi:hypothetical protein